MAKTNHQQLKELKVKSKGEKNKQSAEHKGPNNRRQSQVSWWLTLQIVSLFVSPLECP